MTRQSPKYSKAAKKRMKKIPKDVLRKRMSAIASIRQSKLTANEKREHALIMVKARENKKHVNKTI